MLLSLPEIFQEDHSDRDEKENLVKNCPIFETMSDEQVALLVGAYHLTNCPFDLDAPPH